MAVVVKGSQRGGSAWGTVSEVGNSECRRGAGRRSSPRQEQYILVRVCEHKLLGRREVGVCYLSLGTRNITPRVACWLRTVDELIPLFARFELCHRKP